MGDVTASIGGQNFRGYLRGAVAGDPVDPYVIYQKPGIETFHGRTSTFITPGRGTASQVLFTIEVALGSPVLVSVDRLIVDVLQTVPKGITILPGWIRLSRFTPPSTGGTLLNKDPLGDSTQVSDGAVLTYGDSSADNSGNGTSSATALAATPSVATPIATVCAPRILSTTATGYEMVDTAAFLIGEPDVTLRAGEALMVSVDYAGTGNAASTGNPTTHKWSVMCDWTEYTP